MQEEIKICLADTHYLSRLGFRNMLAGKSGYRLLAEIGDEMELLQYVRDNNPDVVVIDYHQPDHFNSQTIRLLREVSPELNILVISTDIEKKNIDQVLEFGANSYLTKNCGEDEILDALKATSRGDRFFCSRILDYLVSKSFSRPEIPVDAVPLTGREIEIVQLISKGLIAKEIASNLNLSTHTVYTHRKNIMKKLQMGSTSELVMYAINKGLVTPEESNNPR